MSVEGIDKIIRLHAGPHPAETGMIPHNEVLEMIASAEDRGGISSRERAELLAAVAMFGDTVPGRPSLLAPDDEAALKSTALSGIETLELFLAQPKSKQESFIVFCVMQGSAEYIGFLQDFIEPGSEDPPLAAYLNKMFSRYQEKLGDGFGPVGGFQVHSVRRNNEIYGYLVDSWFPKLQSQITEYCSSVVGAKLHFSKLVYKDAETPEED